jgi:hypothetical protein
MSRIIGRRDALLCANRVQISRVLSSLSLPLGVSFFVRFEFGCFVVGCELEGTVAGPGLDLATSRQVPCQWLRAGGVRVATVARWAAGPPLAHSGTPGPFSPQWGMPLPTGKSFGDHQGPRHRGWDNRGWDKPMTEPEGVVMPP